MASKYVKGNLKKDLETEKKRLQTDRARPSERSRQGDEVARIKGRAATRTAQIKARVPMKHRTAAGNEAQKKRSLARHKQVTAQRVATAAADNTYDASYRRRVMQPHTPATRAKAKAASAARRKKRLQG